jgi:Host cell surface-exposed lipoprotein/Protein of unknown function (DUF2510)/Glucodextranase, domain B
MAKGDGEAPKPVRPLPTWVPAGWYPDPLGQGAARYWDGERWTLEYRDSPPPNRVPTSPSEVPAPPSPPSGAVSGSPSGAQPGLRDRWRETSKGVRVIIVGFGLILLIIVIGAIAGEGENKKTASSEPGTQAGASEQKPPAPPVALRLDTGDYAVTSSHTTLHGTVTPGAFVTVDGDRARVHGTHWSKTVALEIGSTLMTVEATLAGYAPASETISVTRHHTQAELAEKAQARKEREERRKETEEQEESEERERIEIEQATLSQQNALKAAEHYLEFTAFSKAGLIEQLSSPAGDQYPYQDAVFAVEHLHVNWDEQAVKSAKKYLEFTSFSCQGMIEQLSSSAGEKFTVGQAEYAAHRVGLC